LTGAEQQVVCVLQVAGILKTLFFLFTSLQLNLQLYNSVRQHISHVGGIKLTRVISKLERAMDHDLPDVLPSIKFN